MSMIEWAEREVEIACKMERPDREEGEWDYGCACYESALKAFKSLCEDGHSGFSFSMTKHILIRLMEGKPLTPIEDVDENWNDVSCDGDDVKKYQCKRMGSLFKDVYPDGTVEYSDVDASYCMDVNNPDATYSFGLVRDVIKELFPITMPYCPPSKAIKVVCEDFLTDLKNGGFDTVGILYAIDPEGERIDIGRYFDGSGTGWREIDEKEYLERKERKIER